MIKYQGITHKNIYGFLKTFKKYLFFSLSSLTS